MNRGRKIFHVHVTNCNVERLAILTYVGGESFMHKPPELCAVADSSLIALAR
jgi:hypothetical protein